MKIPGNPRTYITPSCSHNSTTMSTSLLDMVVHYQRKVERSNDEEKILHCFSKLQKLPITVEVLSQTGVGKTVNAFRRDPGPVGETSRKLVAKWKDIFEENEKRLKRLKAEKEAAVRAERERSRAGERGHDKERHRNRERERSRERSREPSELRSREQSEERSREHSAERSASPADSEASDRMEVDEARALEEQARAEAEAEAEAARQVEAERRAKDEEKRRRREERARREAEKNGVVVKEEHKSHSSRDKHSSSDKHRKESKHRKHDLPLENGHSEPLFAVVKEEKSDHRHNGRAEGEKSHHSSHHHRSKHGSSSGHSSGEKHASPDEQYTPSEKHHSSSEKRSSSEKHSSKDKSRGDEASSSKSHHKSRSNGALEASHSSSSSKKSSHADSETDASREARRSKHKSKRDKHEKRSSKSEKKEDKKPMKLREVDFLCQPGGNDSDADQGGSFADALGGSDATPKKKKKKSKSSSSSHAASSSSAAASAVPTYIPTRVADLPRPPPPPPAMEVLDALPEISATYRPLPRPAAPAAAPARPAAKRALDEDEALKAVLAGKNKRTKVYSGARSTGLSRVPTLLDICLRCLMENIDNVEQTGGVPYEILRTVLEKCTANQLSTIEYYNPYLLEDTDVLWEALVKKEFKCERREEMETWREMYARCSEERKQKYNKLRSMIEGKRKESLASSRKTKVAYEHTVAKPPRNIARKQAKHGTAVAASMPAPTVLAGGGSRPPRPAPGTDPTSRTAAPNRAAAPPKKKAPLMAKVLRAMGRR